MNIAVKKNGGECVVTMGGRLDTTTAPELEKALAEVVDSADSIVLDMEGLAYVSSAGLRVLLGAQKKVNARKAAMVLKNVDDMVREVFEVTGFLDILTIED